jgi:imidazolonepropionase-like amidohydrolase
MVPHGLIRAEISALLACGLTGEQALGAGSWYGRRFLGLPGVEEGAITDIVAYRDDPRSDPEVLRRPALRILNGRQIDETARGN